MGHSRRKTGSGAVDCSMTNSFVTIRLGKTSFTNFGDATINSGLNYLLQIAQWFN